MEFRQRGQRDERRRRVLMDENRGLSADSGPNTGSGDHRPGQGRLSRSYSEAATDSRQPPVTRLLPRRLWTLLVLFLGGLVLIAAVSAFHIQIYQWMPASLQGGFSGLDLARRGSLGHWLGALLLAVAAAYSAAVFHLRRHKLDDYRGKYRVWVPASIGLLLASMDTATGLHDGVAALMQRALGPAPVGDPSFWWLATLGSGFTVLAVRMLVEVRASRLATVCLVAAGGLYAVAATVVLELDLAAAFPLPALVGAIATLVADLFLLMAVLSYSRYVYRDAQGLLAAERRAAEAKREARRMKKAAKRSKESDQEKPDLEGDSGSPAPAAKTVTKKRAKPAVERNATVRVDPAHASPPPTADHGSDDEASEADPDEEKRGRKLSKAERRRQRKLARQQNRG